MDYRGNPIDPSRNGTNTYGGHVVPGSGQNPHQVGVRPAPQPTYQTVQQLRQQIPVYSVVKQAPAPLYGRAVPMTPTKPIPIPQRGAPLSSVPLSQQGIGVQDLSHDPRAASQAVRGGRPGIDGRRIN